MSQVSPEVWIGLINVKPKPGHEDRFNGPGAFTNMLVLADSAAEYVEKITAACDDDDLQVVEADDVEPLRERMKQYEVTEEIVRLAADAIDGNVVGDGFFVYLSDEDDDSEGSTLRRHS